MLTLHFAPQSRAVRIAWLFAELDLDYNLNAMRFHTEDLKSDAHRARHPLGHIRSLTASKSGRAAPSSITSWSATRTAA